MRINTLCKSLMFLPSILVLESCLGAQKTSEIDPKSLIESMSIITTGGEQIEASILSDSLRIDISQVASGKEISKVEYQLKEGVIIYPELENLIGEWDENEHITLIKNGVSTPFEIRLTDFTEGKYQTDAVIYPLNTYGRVTQHLGYDLKDNNGRLAKMENALQMFHTDDFDAIRVPIWGIVEPGQTDAESGHPAPGEVNAEVYQRYINAMNNARTARAGKDLTIFASKKIFHAGLDGVVDGQFPSWVQPKGTKTIIPEMYAQMLVDYIKFFKDNGFEIEVLGPDNESILNRCITAQVHVKVVKELRRLCEVHGLKMPQIIGREAWEPNASHNQWMKDVIKLDPTALNVYGVHYYPEKDHPVNFKALQNEINTKGDRPFWASEPHWNSQREVDESLKLDGDMLRHSERAMSCLWAHTDLGMDAFVWWGYNNTDTGLRGQLMQAASVPLHGAQPIKLEDHDGDQDVLKYTDNTLKTRAFIEDDMVTLYVMNVVEYAKRETEGRPYLDYSFSLDQSVVDGDITYTQWIGAESKAADFTVTKDQKLTEFTGKNSFEMDFPTRSITMIQFKIKAGL